MSETTHCSLSRAREAEIRIAPWIQRAPRESARAAVGTGAPHFVDVVVQHG